MAQNYPTKTISLVVPLAAGTGIDLVARIYAEALQAALKQSVIVENQPGAGTRVGTSFVAKAAPDGHTLLVGTSGVV